MFRRTLALTCAVALALAAVAPAYAHDCLVPKKKTGAGSVGVVNLNTGQFTPGKSNPGTADQVHGGFITLTDGNVSADTFAHAPQGVLPPTREDGSQYNCDGKGLDAASVCFGE